MQTLEPILAEHPFFKGLKPEYLQLITGCASNVRFDAGTYIFREGEEASQFYLIRQGKVALEIFAAQHGLITIETIEAGEVTRMVVDFPSLPLAFQWTCLRADSCNSIGWKMSAC